MKTENLSALKIHKLTDAQHKREKAAGNLDSTALYLTPATSICYATCDVAKGTQAKTAALTTGSLTLTAGARVAVKFKYENTAAAPTLNVDDTGAKAIYWNGAALSSPQYWQAGATLEFIYNGTQWDLVGIAKDNNTHITYSLSANQTSSSEDLTLKLTPSSGTANTVAIKGGGATTVSKDVSGAIYIESKDTKYTHPTYTNKSSGFYKVTVDTTGHVSATTAVQKSDITGLGIPAQDTTYSAATTSAAGLMSAADKTKLDGIATGATKITVDSSLSSTSTNPVQNKAVNTALGNKQATITGAATTITGSNLTTSRALISNSSGKVAVSDVTSTELGYLDGVTSNVQTQLNNVNDAIDKILDGDTPVMQSKYLQPISMSNTDLNTLKTSGHYAGYTGMTNAPYTSGYAAMEVIAYSTDYVMQRFISIQENYKIYERVCYGGSSWTSWKRVDPNVYAPSGYGLGTVAMEVADANDATENGWYKVTSNKNVPFNYCSIHTIKYSDKYIVQNAYNSGSPMKQCTRIMNDGTWEEWTGGLLSCIIDQPTSEADLDAKLKNIFDGLPNDSVIYCSLVDGSYTSFHGGSVTFEIFKQVAGYGVIKAIRYENNIIATEKKRLIYNNIWHDWDWIQAPLNIGVEYRTAERWEGYPVYKKLISVGSMPNNATKEITLTGMSPSSHKFVDVKWSFKYGSSYMRAGYLPDSLSIAFNDYNHTGTWLLELVSTADYSIFNNDAYIMLAYIKF